VSDNHDAAYFAQKAAQCFRLARGCTDAELASRLRQLGYEFVREAIARGADPSSLPTLPEAKPSDK